VRRFAVLLILCALATPVAAARAWTWPVDGPVLRPFSFDRAQPYAAGQHRGVDLGAPTGSKVVAPVDGMVSFAGTVPTGGKTVSIQTPLGYTATLVHLGSIGVSRGARIGEGSVVGTVGPSGTVDLSEPYVYFGVRLTSDPQGYVDPLTLLPARPAAPVSPAPAPVVEPSTAAPVGAVPAPAVTSDTPAAIPAATEPSSQGVADSTHPSVDRPVVSERPAGENAPAEAGHKSASARAVKSTAAHAGSASAGKVSVSTARAATPSAAAETARRLTQAPAARTDGATGRRLHGPHDVPTAHTRLSTRSANTRRIPWLLLPVALALVFSLAFILRRAGGREAARIMCVPEPGPSFVGTEATAQDLGGARLTICVGEASSGPRRRVRGSGGHLRALPPIEGERRADGEWHRRTRHTGDGHGGSRRRLAA